MLTETVANPGSGNISGSLPLNAHANKVMDASATLNLNDTIIYIKNNTTLKTWEGIYYTWAPTTSITDSTIFNLVASPTTTTTYSVTLTNVRGCVSFDTVRMSKPINELWFTKLLEQ